mmetsp:Transcript_13781/g.40810  ORF Transcript_13781/g.40810 Transcript_13781/m.40810 type:complete len:332 (-) Transcript_13781:216-1211(-)
MALSASCAASAPMTAVTAAVWPFPLCAKPRTMASSGWKRTFFPLRRRPPAPARFACTSSPKVLVSSKSFATAALGLPPAPARALCQFWKHACTVTCRARSILPKSVARISGLSSASRSGVKGTGTRSFTSRKVAPGASSTSASPLASPSLSASSPSRRASNRYGVFTATVKTVSSSSPRTPRSRTFSPLCSPCRVPSSVLTARAPPAPVPARATRARSSARGSLPSASSTWKSSPKSQKSEPKSPWQFTCTSLAPARRVASFTRSAAPTAWSQSTTTSTELRLRKAARPRPSPSSSTSSMAACAPALMPRSAAAATPARLRRASTSSSVAK